jgi:hypothetical protein
MAPIVALFLSCHLAAALILFPEVDAIKKV